MARKRPGGVPAEAEWDEDSWQTGPRDGKGRKQGTWRYWHASGRPLGEYGWQDDELHGKGVSQCGSAAPGDRPFDDTVGRKVWRRDQEHDHGSLVSERYFTRQGAEVGVDGEPLPPRPEGVPKEASYNVAAEAWVIGFGGTGRSRMWTRDGRPLQDLEYRDGQPHGRAIWWKYDDLWIEQMPPVPGNVRRVEARCDAGVVEVEAYYDADGERVGADGDPIAPRRKSKAPPRKGATAAAIRSLERFLGAKLPSELAKLYAKEDGEEELLPPYRLMSVEEVRAVPFERGYLAHCPERAFFRKTGSVLRPFFTNDNSDHVAVFLAGPLEGMLCFVLHDEGSFPPAFRSVASFLRALRAARTGTTQIYQLAELYGAGGKPNEEDWARARRLGPAFAKQQLDDLGRGCLETWLRALTPAEHRKALVPILEGLGIRGRAYRPEDLVFAATRGELDKVKAALASGLHVDTTHDVFGTALSRAAEYGRIDVVKYLLSRGADPDAHAPLPLAAKAGRLAIVKLLLAAKADVTGTFAGESALALAAGGGHAEVVSVLTAAGAKR